MSIKNHVPQHVPSGENNPADLVSEPISHNIETILEFYKREEEKVSGSQRLVEVVSDFIGRPIFLGLILVFVVLWILVNVWAHQLNLPQFDPPPFFWLVGVVGLAALLMTIVVLIKQNRLALFEEQRAHLELQLHLLTEQKTTKLIHLIEELRHDLPMVKDRHDPEAEALKQATDPQQMLDAMDEMREAGGQAKPAGRLDASSLPTQIGE